MKKVTTTHCRGCGWPIRSIDKERYCLICTYARQAKVKE